jgi:hypothetical protein
VRLSSVIGILAAAALACKEGEPRGAARPVVAPAGAPSANLVGPAADASTTPVALAGSLDAGASRA